MSIAVQTAKTQVVISALPQTAAVGFPFVAAADLRLLDSSTEPATELTLGSDYTVTGGGYNSMQQMQTGSVVIVAGGVGDVQVGDTITILSDVPYTQTLSFQTLALNPKLIEAALDKLTKECQQLRTVLDLCLRFQDDEDLDGTLAKSARENSLLGFDSLGRISFTSTSTLTPMFSYQSSLTHETGGTSSALDAFSTNGLLVKYVVAFKDSVNADALTFWELVTSSATPGTGIVQPLDNSALRWFQRL